MVLRILHDSFEKAIEYRQMYHKTLNNLATTYFRLGRLEQAEVVFQESIQSNPDQPMTYNNLGKLAQAERNSGENVSDFCSHIAIWSTNLIA